MRLALLSDIHGNSLALDAVLNDIQAHGPIDRYVLVGDYLAIGPDPAGVMACLLGLPNAVFVRGNTDHDLIHLWSDDLAQANPPQLPHALGYFIDVMWTRGAVNQPDWLDWLAALPIEQRLTLHDGTRLLAVHASPCQNDGAGIHPRRSPQQLRESLSGCQADLVVVGHSHIVMNIHVDGMHVVNLGNVSLPMVAAPEYNELRASYVLLESNAHGYHLEHRCVDYDHETVIALAKERRHPSAERIARYLRGQNLPWWLAA